MRLPGRRLVERAATPLVTEGKVELVAMKEIPAAAVRGMRV